ncbi:hypothetical protein Ddye_028003 [Dipteronia dyeriana]|uniref:Cellulose synthase n=1 Tax=Dipteronia dyeriana TaxID=168575 RepID=A0AAD9TR17_9ROSI|nr:hypothetical protein Ddye_028003 [Dipteronia dyeriana]
MGSDGYVPLFETKKVKGNVIYKLFAVSIFFGICLILVYRYSHIPREGEDGRWAWIDCLWLSCGSVFSGYDEVQFPRVDVFVCKADPTIEPPILVINTVLSVLAYDYPTEKLSVYLSDDAGSDITFYALLEASHFVKEWIPYCKKFRVEPRSPEAYFLSISDLNDVNEAKEFEAIKKLYEDMENRITRAAKVDQLTEEQQSKHKGFSHWDSYSSIRDHDTILQILIDRRDRNARDIEGYSLPTLVYLAREKRPQYPHNFKAGAMNALIRVSGKISNGQIIHNVDCDMYSNDSQSVRDALCFFMDEEKGQEVAFVQFSEGLKNVTKNEIYVAHFE